LPRPYRQSMAERNAGSALEIADNSGRPLQRVN
jgi:hypothetical protein